MSKYLIKTLFFSLLIASTLLLFANSTCTKIVYVEKDPPPLPPLPPPTPQNDRIFDIVTEKLYNKIGSRDFVNLKFYISKDIKLEILGINTMPDYDKNKVIEIRHQDTIYLRAGTPGRVKGTPNGKRLEIAFEKIEGEESEPTFVFVQKYSGDDRYYLEIGTENRIKYRNMIWNVSYSAGISSHFKNFENIYNDIKDEPYLIYELDKQSDKTEREIKGLE